MGSMHSQFSERPHAERLMLRIPVVKVVVIVSVILVMCIYFVFQHIHPTQQLDVAAIVIPRYSYWLCFMFLGYTFRRSIHSWTNDGLVFPPEPTPTPIKEPTSPNKVKGKGGKGPHAGVPGKKN